MLDRPDKLTIMERYGLTKKYVIYNFLTAYKISDFIEAGTFMCGGI